MANITVLHTKTATRAGFRKRPGIVGRRGHDSNMGFFMKVDFTPGISPTSSLLVENSRRVRALASWIRKYTSSEQIFLGRLNGTESRFLSVRG
jgi:hypothetical protein